MRSAVLNRAITESSAIDIPMQFSTSTLNRPCHGAGNPVKTQSCSRKAKARKKRYPARRNECNTRSRGAMPLRSMLSMRKPSVTRRGDGRAVRTALRVGGGARGDDRIPRAAGTPVVGLTRPTGAGDIIPPVTSEAWGSQPTSSTSGVSASAALRHILLWASRRGQIKRAGTSAPVTRDVVRRFVAGETIEDAVAVTRALTGEGLTVSLDHLGEDTLDARTARAAVAAYCSLAGRLADEGLAPMAERSVKV